MSGMSGRQLDEHSKHGKSFKPLLFTAELGAGIFENKDRS